MFTIDVMRPVDNCDICVAGVSGDHISPELLKLTAALSSTIVSSAPLFEILKRNDSSFVQRNWIPISPISVCIAQMGQALEHGPIVVFTSGDPLFFGFGRLIEKHFPGARVSFLPAVSSMQLCFAGFGIPWDDAACISLHGRPLSLLRQKLHERKLFILTDRENSPSSIASYLVDSIPKEEIKRYIIYVGSKLGTLHESFVCGSPEEIAGMSFQQPNCLIVMNTDPTDNSQLSRLGLDETELQHSRGLITKNEVRAAVLHSLALPNTGVLWDIGAGSGSVSVEAARCNPELDVYAVEHKEREVQNITHNRSRFKCWNIKIIHGAAPEILATLPLPDRVFIGGSGGRLEEIVRSIVGRVPPETRIVLTGVLESTYRRAPELLHELGYQVDISVLSTTRYCYPSRENRVLNPIHIIRARKRHV